VLDFTAELGRYAIQRATARDTDAVRSCRDLVDALQGQFLQFDLRNSGLRRKYDGLKYRLKELEVRVRALHTPDD
jgi:predicted translin family RNA/ssDNA-binding protein